MLDEGINAQMVAQALDHANVSATIQIYGNQGERWVAQAACQAELAPFEESAGLSPRIQ